MISEFNLEFLISSIETLCKQKSISVKSALEECGLKRVVVDNMKKGSVPSVDKIYTLANFFGVSVDYLLGRTDEPKTETSDPTTQILVERFRNLSPEDKIDVLNIVLDKSKKI